MVSSQIFETLQWIRSKPRKLKNFNKIFLSWLYPKFKKIYFFNCIVGSKVMERQMGGFSNVKGKLALRKSVVIGDALPILSRKYVSKEEAGSCF